MKRALLGLALLLGGCPPEGSQSITLSITPASFTRPCIVRKILVLDDQGGEYRGAESDCNEAVIELLPGRRFVGLEFLGNDVGASDISVYLSE